MRRRWTGLLHGKTYRHVMLPMVRPATAAAAALSFVHHWQEFIGPLIYLSDFTTFPVSLGLRMYQSLSGTWANQLMAASLTSLIPVIVMFVVTERYLMRRLEERDTGE